MTRWGTAVTVAGLLLLVYGLTLPPSLTWSHHGADGGDLAAAVVRGSIPHPPGFPTYLLLGGLFVRLPWGDPAQRLSALSALMAAAAAGLTVLTVSHLLGEAAPGTRTAPPAKSGIQSDVWASACAGLAGLSLGLAPLFWSQALIVEVYAPAAFFAALAIWLNVRGSPAWWVGLAWGVGTGVHPTLLFLAPLLLGDPRPRRLLQVGLAALVGCGLMFGPVLLFRARVPSPWADVTTLAGWWELVSGRLYRAYLLALPLAAVPARALAWVGLLLRQATSFGAVLAGWGWGHLWRARRSLAVLAALSFAAANLYALTYDTADSLVYLVPFLPLAALGLGVGVARAAERVGRPLRWAFVLLPVLQAALFWGQVDLSRDHAARDWADALLDGAPPQAVLLTAQDAHTFALWYAQEALAMRPDVVVLDADLWAHPPYRRLVGAALGLDAGDLSPAEAARRAARPLVDVGQVAYPPPVTALDATLH
ncbi:MAG: DUF2723 domain-containing protein [Anaerolineae bacterium]|nr:DUF2723 domain-containing protein [Anaerolineae bacterium]